MFPSESPAGNHNERFSPLRFIAVLGLSYLSSLILLYVLLWTLGLEQWFRRSQLQASATAYIATFILCGLFNCLVEYLFHRAVLHAPLIPYLLVEKWGAGRITGRKFLDPLVLRLARAFYSFYVQHHRVHHPLTDITRRKESSSSEDLVVHNRYPIVHEHQHEASYFPDHTYFMFLAFALPFFTPVQIIFPNTPIFLMGFTGLAVSLALYEIRHAADHWPEERLEKLFSLPLLGEPIKEWFKFHRAHHANVDVNMAISGFFLIPVFDYVFRTYKRIKTFYPHKSKPHDDDFEAPEPRFLGWLTQLIHESREWKAASALQN